MKRLLGSQIPEFIMPNLRRHVLMPVIISLSTLIPRSSVHAEITIDDFEDSANAISPAMFDDFMTTENVGTLRAKRSIRIAGSQSDPVGSLDSNLSTPSLLTGAISELNSDGSARVLIQCQYEFALTDFTEAGLNDSILFDFHSVDSEIQPSLFRVRVDDNVDFFFHFDMSFGLNRNPFTVGVPFNLFRPRGGPNMLDATSIRFLDFQLWVTPISGGGPERVNFRMQLDRIRVGRIPEPNSVAILIAGLFALLLGRYRWPIDFYGGKNHAITSNRFELGWSHCPCRNTSIDSDRTCANR